MPGNKEIDAHTLIAQSASLNPCSSVLIRGKFLSTLFGSIRFGGAGGRPRRSVTALQQVIEHGHRQQCNESRKSQTADDGEGEGFLQLGPGAEAEGEGKQAK